MAAWPGQPTKTWEEHRGRCPSRLDAETSLKTTLTSCECRSCPERGPHPAAALGAFQGSSAGSAQAERQPKKGPSDLPNFRETAKTSRPDLWLPLRLGCCSVGQGPASSSKAQSSGSTGSPEPPTSAGIPKSQEGWMELFLVSGLSAQVVQT